MSARLSSLTHSLTHSLAACLSVCLFVSLSLQRCSVAALRCVALRCVALRCGYFLPSFLPSFLHPFPSLRPLSFCFLACFADSSCFFLRFARLAWLAWLFVGLCARSCVGLAACYAAHWFALVRACVRACVRAFVRLFVCSFVRLLACLLVVRGCVVAWLRCSRTQATHALLHYLLCFHHSPVCPRR